MLLPFASNQSHVSKCEQISVQTERKTSDIAEMTGLRVHVKCQLVSADLLEPSILSRKHKMRQRRNPSFDQSPDSFIYNIMKMSESVWKRNTTVHALDDL